MIKKEGHWCAIINDDEILPEELRFMVITEEVGLGLPILKLHFVTQDEDKVKNYNTPGYEINVGLGFDSIECTGKYKVAVKQIRTFGGFDGWAVEVHCVLASLDYLTKQRMHHYNKWTDKKKSSEVWKIVAERNNLTADTEESNDEMLWIQPNLTDRQFLEDISWHGFFSEGDPTLTAIRRDQKAVYKPLSKLMEKRAKKVGNNLSCEVISNDFTVHQDGGILSAWGGKTRRIPVHKMEEGINETKELETQPKITSNLGLIDVTRTQERKWLNDNVHENWWVAYAQNRQLRSSLSSSSISVLVSKYSDIHLLDPIELSWQRVSNSELLPTFSGKWIVTKIITGISAHDFNMEVTLNRESLI